MVYARSNQCPPTPEPDPLVLGTGNWGLTGGPRRGVVWRPCSFNSIHSLTGPVGQCLLPAQEDCDSHPRDAPTLTMEPGSSVSDVSLHW